MMSVRLVAVLGVLTLCVSSCGLRPPGQHASTRTIALPAGSPCVLVVLTNPESPQAMRITGALIAATARAGERVVLLSDQDGATLASALAPRPPSTQIPLPPPPLAPDPTSFQKARYAQAVRQYQSTVRRAMAALRQLQQQELAAWAASTIARADAAPKPTTAADSISAGLGAAAADLSSLRQAGLDYGAGTVIAVIGVNAAIATSAPVPPSGLQASTIVVDDFPGSSNQEAAWQASLLQAGAARVVLLTLVTDDQLGAIVQQGLDGTITDTLTNVLFALGQYTLRPAALPQMRQLLRLLAVTYPRATASINGYTDDLPTPGGNLELSALRAQEVEEWLVAHGIAAGRLQANGYGDTDPVAPNTPSGQPLNRRVVIIINPALPWARP